MIHAILLFNQNIRDINPQISNMQVHKCTSDHGRECRTPRNIELCYGLIPPPGSDIVKP